MSRRCPSTAKQEDIKQSVRKLLNRHSIVFGDYTWTEFDEPFLARHVQSVAIVDTELKAKDPQVPTASAVRRAEGSWLVRGARGLDPGLLGALGRAGRRLHLRGSAETKTHRGRGRPCRFAGEPVGSSDGPGAGKGQGLRVGAPPRQGARSTVGAQVEAEASGGPWGAGLCC